MQSFNSITATNAYSSASMTAAPGVRVVMLYDGAIGRLRDAKRAIDEGRIEDRFHLVQRAAALLEGLQSSLDFDRGGDIARYLDSLYSYFIARLQRIHVTNDPALCDELIERLSELRESWAAIAEGASAVQSNTGPAISDKAELNVISL